MPRRRNPRQNARRQRIQDVRITDGAAGSDGARVDRMVAAMKESESQTRVMVGFIQDVFPTTTDTNGTIGFDEITNSDEFTSLIQQYNLFRIRSMKFDVYDVNSNVAVVNQWGVWHDNYETTLPSYTRQNIADLPDSRVISVGTGQTTLYWVAHGTAEMQFQADSSTGSPIQRFGGLKYSVGPLATTVPKYTITVHAVVDFRGRR